MWNFSIDRGRQVDIRTYNTGHVYIYFKIFTIYVCTFFYTNRVGTMYIIQYTDIIRQLKFENKK